MSYVDNNLVPGEHVVYRATLHWSIFLPAIVWGVIGLLFCLGGIASGEGLAVAIGALFLVVAILVLLRPLITYLTTEMAITNRRVIGKRGLIRQDTAAVEILDAGRSLQVNRGGLDLAFNRGTVTVFDAANRKRAFPGISKPLEFQRNALQASDIARGR